MKRLAQAVHILMDSTFASLDIRIVKSVTAQGRIQIVHHAGLDLI